MDEVTHRVFSGLVFCEQTIGTVTLSSDVRDHAILHILSGEMIIEKSGRRTRYGPGETHFIRRRNNVRLEKHLLGAAPFRSLYFELDRSFLKERFRTVTIPARPIYGEIPAAKRIDGNPAIDGLIASLDVYFERKNVALSDDFVQLKKREALLALLTLDEAFYPCLFDFADPWKIDLESFMRAHFQERLTLPELAALSGRSLSAFKRDFHGVFGTTPERWVMAARLDEARRLIVEKKRRPSAVYESLGFRNLAHFTAAFRRRFGFPPGFLAAGEVFVSPAPDCREAFRGE